MKIVILDSHTNNPGDLSWAAVEARKRIIDVTAYNIQSFLEGNPVNVVN